MERRGDLEGALGVFERSLEIDEGNKMARFRKARVLMGLQRYDVSPDSAVALACFYVFFSRLFSRTKSRFFLCVNSSGISPDPA
jgi:hypothetical protein